MYAWLFTTFDDLAKDTFARVGRFIAYRARVVLCLLLAVLLALGCGVLNQKLETDALSLWVDESTRLIEQIHFLQDHFPSFREVSFVIRPKLNASLLTKDAWNEVYRVHEWVRQVSYTKDGVNYSLDNICYKVLQSDPAMPCFVVTPLDCFLEGVVVVPGGGNGTGAINNTQFGSLYQSATSFRSPEWSFSANFTEEFIDKECRAWSNTPIAPGTILGGMETSAGPSGSVVTKLQAMSFAVFLKNEEDLAQQGAQYMTFGPAAQGEDRDLFNCPLDMESPKDCAVCALGFTGQSALTSGCNLVPGSPAGQPAECCEDYMPLVLGHECLSYMAANFPTFTTVGTNIANECGLKVVLSDSTLSRCTRLQDNSSTAACKHGYTDWLSACQVAAAANGTSPDVLASCCQGAGEFSEKGCMCSSICDDTCWDSVLAMDAACSRAGARLPPLACARPEAEEPCAQAYLDWTTSCDAARADPANLLSGFGCCEFGKGLVELGCACMEPCDEACTSRLASNNAQCSLFNLGYSAPACGSNSTLPAHEEGSAVGPGDAGARTLEDKLKHIRRARSIVAAANISKSRDSVFPLNFEVYALSEQYLRIHHTLRFMLLLGLAGAAVVLLLLLGHPVVVLIVLAVIVLAEVELYGLMSFLNMKMNSVVIGNMLMSVGYFVEATCHIARHYLLADGHSPQRAEAAIRRIGSPVLNSSMTTVASIALVAFSTYKYFLTYFVLQYLAIALVSLINGLVLLPILLAALGARTTESFTIIK